MKFYTRINLLVLLLACFAVPALGQAINIGAVDAGPYTPGSTISVPISVDYSSGCVKTNNVYTLYLSDAFGSFGARQAIGTFNGFYATFVNGIIPVGITPGTGYKIEVESSVPIVTSAPVSINIIAGTAVAAAITAPPINAAHPDVFGNCNGTNFNFIFSDNSTAGSTVTAIIHNEASASTTGDAIIPLAPAGNFAATTTNYTIFVKATNGTSTGTRAYMLINNVVNSNFGTTGTTSVCLGSSLTFTVDVGTANGIQHNFPGNIYTVKWGDGSVHDYTLCEIVAGGGKITHTYSRSSCGTIINGQSNVFEVDLQPTSPYCTSIASPVTSYAKISSPPTNAFSANLPVANTTCTGNTVVFSNNSYPGEDPNNTTGACGFAGARYAWLVDGIPVSSNRTLAANFSYTFTTSGTHTVTLQLQNNPSTCPVANFSKTICVQDSPNPSFTVPSTLCTAAGPVTVTPVNTFTTDNTCYTNPFKWTVTGGLFTFAGGTSLTSVNPQFVFNTPGTYLIDLAVTDACGTKKSAVQQKIIVNTTPTAALSPDVSYCGTQTLTFNNTTGSSTKTTFTGTTDPTAPGVSFQWTVTPAPGVAAATFTGGTTAASEYPTIKFPGYGLYTVSVTHTNNCGVSATATQQINIQNAPEISAGALNNTVCALNGYFTLSGSIRDPGSTVQSYKWTTSGDGTFDNSTTSLTPKYTLGSNDIIRGGTIQITLTAISNLIGQCSTIPQTINLTIAPPSVITSANAVTVCSGTALDYLITSTRSGTGASYTWTATAPANITGYTQHPVEIGEPVTIHNVLTNTNPLVTSKVTYTIIPYANGCAGTPFTLEVTVVPGPVITAVPTTNPICSGGTTNIKFTSNVTGTKYIWTATLVSGITGASNQSVPTSIAAITDQLVNSNTTNATVIYQITPVSPGGCFGSPVSVTITVQPPPTTANAGADNAVCNTTFYQLNGNVPVSGTGKWTIKSGQTGITFDNAATAKTIVRGLVPGQTYLFTWTIADNCNNSNSDDVQLIDNLPTVAGTVSTLSNPVCTGSNGTLTLAGNTGNVTAWEQSTDNGISWQTIANTTTSLNYTNLTQTTRFRAVVQNGSCSISTSLPLTVTVNPVTVIPNAGPDQLLCNQTNTTLHGNDPGIFTGQWTQTSGPTAGVTINNPNAYITTVTGLVGGNNYTFTWTIHGIPPCADLTDDVAIVDQSQVINTININGSDAAFICAGTSVNITGDLPTGGVGPYSYVWEQSIDNGATWNTIGGQTNQNATMLLTVPVLIRRTVYSNQQICNVVSNVLDVKIQTSISKNSVSTTSAEICNNTIPAVITGTIPAGGDGTYTYQWQSSTDGTTFANIAGATAKNYQPATLSATTYYQRIVNSSLCGGSLSNVSNKLTIVVDPDVIAKFTADQQIDCAPFNISSQIITAYTEPNAQTYTWYADGIKIGEGLSFPGYTIQNDGQTVAIKLVVSSQFGCDDATFALNFSTPKKVVPGFNIDKITSCGPVTVNFTNTSVPTTGVVFTWIFGDGTTYTGTNPPAHTFQPLANGKDVTYTITLTSDGCSPAPFTRQVTVYPDKPVAAIDPGTLTGCAPYTLDIANLSPGTNASYTYYLYDNNNALVQTIVKTDKTDAIFNPVSTNTTKIYTLYMVAKNLCGVTAETTHYPIVISAPVTTALMNITPLNPANAPAGCAPYAATFHNLSAGGSNYVYNIYDSNFNIIASVVNNTTDDQDYTFTTPGTYYVSIGVFSNCIAGKESAKLKVVVYAIPAPAFTANSTTDCTQLSVKFDNNTLGDVNAPAVSYKYDWDFGDGTHSADFAPTHTYDFKKSPYTVTLTATSNNGCEGSTIKTDYIIVNPPPGTDFTALPDTVISIPNYHFDFQDQTTIQPVSWSWDLGDGSTSTLQNPSHTYADTGRYVVTLTTVSPFGCSETKRHIVRITGVPGQLYVPNAFMPTSLSDELRIFTVKGSGIKIWSMRIFNNWGQMVFETHKLNSKGEPLEFWDGRYKGQDAQQGVYAWQISATFINGTEWKGMTYKGEAPKRAGTLNLIR